MSDSSLEQLHAPPISMTYRGYPAVIWSNRHCGNCDHFEPQVVGNTDIGYCCRKAPVPFMGVGPNPMALADPKASPMAPQLQGIFPPTHKTKKCGEWEPKIGGSA